MRAQVSGQLLGAAGLGAEAGAGDRSLAWRIVLACTAAYALSFALFYPNVATNVDEAEYIRQAQSIVDGRHAIEVEDPFTGEVEARPPTTYPLGVALTASPFVWLCGWRGAFLVPLVGLLAVVLLTARWLADEGRSPLYALIVLGFVPTLVLGRVVMSDVPSAGVAALGLWLFWRGLDGGAPWWLGSGFVAGASMAFRASNPILFVPLFAGTVLRRDRRCLALVAGGLAGLAARFASMRWYFGDLLFERGSYRWSPDTLDERLPLYLLGLLVLVPGGLALSLAYRGRRRPEILGTVVLFVLVFLFQEFSTVDTSPAKRVVLGLRYLIPVVPVMAFAMAESGPRLWKRWTLAAAPARRQRLERAAALLLLLAVAGIGTAAAAVHPLFSAWGASQVAIRAAISEHVADDAVLVTNWPATRKFLHELERRYVSVQRHKTEPARLAELALRHGEFYLVLLDRSDSKSWRRGAQANAAFVEAAPVSLELLLDRQFSTTDHLRIWRATARVEPIREPARP